MLDIPTNHFRRYLVPDTSDKIPIVPQFSTPQLSLHLRKLLQYQPGRNTFQPLHHLRRTIPWWDRKKDMHMIIQDLLGIDGKAIPLGNLLKNPLQAIRDSLAQNHATIFGYSHHMILAIVNSASGAFETHAWKNTKPSPLLGLAFFLPLASWGYPRADFYESGYGVV